MTLYIPEQHGNKTVNLQRLNELFRNDPNVSIPDFIGLSHDDICAHLLKFDININARWNIISQLMGKPSELNDEVKKSLKRLKDDIEDCLTKNPIPQKKIANLMH